MENIFFPSVNLATNYYARSWNCVVVYEYCAKQAFVILPFSQTRTLFRNNKLYDQPFMVPYVQDITNQAQLSPEQQIIHLKLKNKWIWLVVFPSTSGDVFNASINLFESTWVFICKQLWNTTCRLLPPSWSTTKTTMSFICMAIKETYSIAKTF